MKITVECSAKELAVLILELQERQNNGVFIDGNNIVEIIKSKTQSN
jgi:hypothetical protein